MSWNRDERLGSSLEDPYDNEVLDNDEELSRGNSDTQRQHLPSLYHGAWPMENDEWNRVNQHDDSTIVASVISFASNTSTREHHSNREEDSPNEGKFDAKMDVIYSLLGMLLGDNVGREDTSSTLLSLSNSEENCLAMRQSGRYFINYYCIIMSINYYLFIYLFFAFYTGCLPLLVQLIHAPEQNASVRRGASRALYNIVRATADPKRDDDELKVLDLVEQLREYSQLLRSSFDGEDTDHASHPISAMSMLMKLSFNENHRHSICLVGGLHAIAELIEMDHLAHASETSDPNCLALRRYSGMTLTNLTFGDSKNKSLLCSFVGFIKVWVIQLRTTNEDLHQVTASVLRNLSWRADCNSKRVLREADSVKNLTEAGMHSRRESTLKSILSALWNLSAHCTTNKADICAVNGALEFLVDMLGFETPSKRLAIIENAGGILRNVSSHVAVEENYRNILRCKDCIPILVRLLSSPSLTVVSNACGTLWNLSARCPKDQKTLWELGTVPILRKLVHSNNKMISVGATSTLRNLLAARNVVSNFQYVQPNFRPSLQSNESVHGQQRTRTENCRSRSVEIDSENRTERPLSSKSCYSSFQRHSSMPLTNTEPRAHNKTNEKSDDSTKVYHQNRRKGSPTSPYFERKNSYESDGDVPIDYREKYLDNRQTKEATNLKIKGRRNKYHERDSNMFSDYAETDLDQPTDYSLRYAEDDTDDEQEDTVMTYCTEGTPYEMTSTATSMSDLRLEDSKDIEGAKRGMKRFLGMKMRNKNSQEKQSLLAEETELENDEKEASNSVNEKPVYYYNEETPGQLSRANSLSSLESSMSIRSPTVTNKMAKDCVNLSQKHSKELTVQEDKDIVENKEEHNIDEKGLDREAKVVTFGGEDHYTDETPMMFSRSSSLGSLSGFESHSIHDDRSSIISDFSRRTSGAVSPSELPDSPTQTVPPSPRHHKDFTNRFHEERRLGSFTRFPCTRPKRSVFEDDIAAFKEESTPIQFSAATSLSSLTIDDEPRVVQEDNQQVEHEPEVIRSDAPSPVDSQEELELKEIVKVHARSHEGSDNEVDGRPNVGNRFIPSSSTNLTRYQTCETLDQLETLEITEMTKEMSLTSPIKPKITNDVLPDTVHIYCTEDTPAVISPVGSQSNLSALSMPSILEDTERPDVMSVLDNTTNLSREEEKILEECIQAGMPKAISHEATNKFDVLLPRPTDIPGASSSSDESLVPTAEEIPVSKQSETRSVDPNRALHNSPLNSDEEALLAEVIHAGMPQGTPKHLSAQTTLSKPLEVRSQGSTSTLHNSPLNSDEEALLAEVIQAGMPTGTPKHLAMPTPICKSIEKRPHGSTSTLHNSPLNSDEEALLAEVIHAGMPSGTPKHLAIQAASSKGSCSTLNSEEAALLAEVIHAGMPPGALKPLALEGVTSKSLDTRSQGSTRTLHNSPLNSDEEALLAEVIHAGMPPGTPKHLAIEAASSKLSQSPKTISPRIYPECDDNSSLSSDEEERLLADCTRRGMPKVIKIIN